MSDFWSKRLGTPAPQQYVAAPQQPPVAPAASGPWWAPQTPAAPVQVQQQPQTNVNSTASRQAAGQQNIMDLLSQQNYSTTKAKSARDDSRCPECSSGNYLHIRGAENAPMRCFECGYNPMFQHSTAGVSATSDGIPTRSARVQQGNTSDYDPKHPVARVTV